VYLVDTNVISEAAPSRGAASADLAAWMDQHSSALYLSAVTVAEIEAGIAKSRRERAIRRADDLTAWLDTLLHLYGDRVLSFDADTARIAGNLSDLARRQGRPPGLADIIIAATAKRRALTILTRNLRHFAPLGVPAHDPFTSLPPS
jgi:predicted nucleic acid-binding protein